MGNRDVTRSLLRAALFVGAFTALDDAAAIEIAIDDTRIELAAPSGYCPLDRKGWPGSQLIDFTSDGIKKQGERLAYFVDCERIRSWPEGASGKDVGDIVDYQASLQLRDQNVTSAMLEELCATLRKGDDSSKGFLDLFLKAIKGAVMGRYGGAEETVLTYVVLGYEDMACHVFSSRLTKSREQIYTVSALALIKSKLVTVHVSKTFGTMDVLKGKTEDIVKHLLDMSQEAATALIDANQ
jgi:hypothetical protein